MMRLNARSPGPAPEELSLLMVEAPLLRPRFRGEGGPFVGICTLLKKVSSRVVIALLLLSCLCTSVRAQVGEGIDSVSTERNNKLLLRAQSFTDSVRLRWAPGSYPLWRQIQEAGLHLERHTLVRNGRVLPLAERRVSTRINTEPLRPAVDAVFSSMAGSDRYVAIGWQAIYGERFQAGEGEADAADYGSILNRAKEDQNRFGFGLFAADQSWRAARAMGLALTDRTVQRNETYLYRLVPATPIAGYDPEASGYLRVMVNDNSPLLPAQELQAAFSDRLAVLQWDLEVASTLYSSYTILRSRDSLTFDPVNRDGLPFVPLVKEGQSPLAVFQDSLPANDEVYFYRVVGNTPFGTQGPVSETVSGMGRYAPPDAPPSLASIFPTEEDGFLISWTFNEAENIKGFRVERANKDQGPYVAVSPLMAPGDRSFTDPAPLPTNYYRVTVYDRYDRPLSSYSALAQLEDETPPAIPTGLRGIILKDGRVVLSWDENTEDDLLGYRIWLSNQATAEYSLATGAPIRENYYIDSTTLNTLSPTLYAKVVSLDHRHNTSDFSAYVALARPDTLPPAAPLITRVDGDYGKISISFAFSRSLDLARHELQERRVVAGDDTQAWTTLITYRANRVRNRATPVRYNKPKGKEYAYRVVATDVNGLRTSSNIMVGSALDDFIRRGVENITPTVDRRARTVQLDWSYRAENNQFKYFEIWRAEGDAPPLPLGQLAGEKSLGRRPTDLPYTYLDEQPLRMNTTYRYYLKAVYADGGASRLSDPVSVDY